MCCSFRNRDDDHTCVTPPSQKRLRVWSSSSGHRGSLMEEAVVVNILPCGGTACGAARHGLGRRHMSSGAVARPPELSSSAASRCGITRSPQRHTWPSHLCTRPGPPPTIYGMAAHGSSNMVFVGVNNVCLIGLTNLLICLSIRTSLCYMQGHVRL